MDQVCIATAVVYSLVHDIVFMCIELLNSVCHFYILMIASEPPKISRRRHLEGLTEFVKNQENLSEKVEFYVPFNT